MEGRSQFQPLKWKGKICFRILKQTIVENHILAVSYSLPEPHKVQYIMMYANHSHRHEERMPLRLSAVSLWQQDSTAGNLLLCRTCLGSSESFSPFHFFEMRRQPQRDHGQKRKWLSVSPYQELMSGDDLLVRSNLDPLDSI